MRTVDTTEYLSVLKELTEEGHEVRLKISGNSMAPFLIHNRDEVFFSKPNGVLKKGDIVLFQRENGQYIMHRIRKVRNEGYYIVGDNQTVVEGPVPRDKIFGLVTKVIRKGTEIAPGDFWWEFFRIIWIRMIPFRRLVTRLYARR